MEIYSDNVMILTFLPLHHISGRHLYTVDAFIYRFAEAFKACAVSI